MVKTWREQTTPATTLGEQLVLMQAEIDELRAELEKSQLHIKHIGNDALRTENANLRVENADHLRQLRKEQMEVQRLHDDFAAMKAQEPVWIVNRLQSENERWIETIPADTKLYAAAGAVPKEPQK